MQQGKPVARMLVDRPVRPQRVVESEDENSSSSSSSSAGESESQLSSLGPWGDDPEIQEKVRFVFLLLNVTVSVSVL